MKYWLISMFLVLLVLIAGCKQGVTGEAIRDVQQLTTAQATIPTTSTIEETSVTTSIETTTSTAIPAFTVSLAKSVVEEYIGGKIEELYKVNTAHNNLVVEAKYYNIDKDGITQTAFEFTQEIAPFLAEYNKGLELTLNAEYGYGSIHILTSNDIVKRIANYELGYDEWRRWSSVSYEGDLYEG